MEEIDDITKIIIGLCAGGCVLRIVFLFIKMGMAELGETNQYKKRIKNTFIFLILAISIFSVKELIMGYYS